MTDDLSVEYFPRAEMNANQKFEGLTMTWALEFQVLVANYVVHSPPPPAKPFDGSFREATHSLGYNVLNLFVFHYRQTYRVRHNW